MLVIALSLVVAVMGVATVWLRRLAERRRTDMFSLAFGILAAAWFSMMALSAKLAAELHGVSPQVNQVARGCVGWALVAIDLRCDRAVLCPELGGRRRPMLSLCGRVAFGIAAMLLYFIGLSSDQLGVGDATALYMTYPLWTVALTVCKGEASCSLALCASSFLCFVGMLGITQPGWLFHRARARQPDENSSPVHEGGDALLPALAMLGSGICMALGVEFLGRLRSECALDARQIVHVFFATTAVVGSVSIALSGEWRSMGSSLPGAWMLLLLCGACGYGAQFSMAAAVLTGETNAAFALTQNVELVLTYAYQVAIFSQPLGTGQVMGALLVALGVFVLKAAPSRWSGHWLHLRMCPPFLARRRHEKIPVQVLPAGHA